MVDRNIQTIPAGQNGKPTVGLTNLKPLTQRQYEVFQSLAALFAELGYCPSLKEWADRAGLKSQQQALEYRTALEKKGYVTRDLGKARSMRIINRPKKSKVKA